MNRIHQPHCTRTLVGHSDCCSFMVNECYQLSRYTSRLQLPTHSTNKTGPILKCQQKVNCITFFPDLTPLSSLHEYQHFSGNLTPPSSGNLPTVKMKATGSSKIPVSIYRPTWSHFPLDPNLDTHYKQNLKSHTCNFQIRCSVDTATTQTNQFCHTFCPLHSFFLTLTVQRTASAYPLTVYKPSPCWEPKAYVTNRLYCIVPSYFVSVSENSQTMATQISQDMQQPTLYSSEHGKLCNY
jgi:hypothetical protein